MTSRTQFHQRIVVVEVNEFGTRRPSTDTITLLSDVYYDSYDVDIKIDKSITSNLDTATVTVHNHPILERMYADKKAFFDEMNEKLYEVDIFQWYECSIVGDDEQLVQCIFTGDLDDISVEDSSDTTDQSLTLSLVSGKRASLRTTVNKAYIANLTYGDVVQDLINLYGGYELTILDDPLNKLSKLLPKTRTVHKKVSEVLDDICRDLEMTWGFDAARYNLSTSYANRLFVTKGLYFVDKISVFDSLPSENAGDANNGVGPHPLYGATGRVGRIGYTKSQFTLTNLTDPVLNIGRSIVASDIGTMFSPSDVNTAFLGRINRMSINNNSTFIECAYIDGEGNAILEYDKKNSGSWVL